MKKFHLHLISDSTGETINTVARAVCAQFEGVQPVEHVYGLVRGQKPLMRALEALEKNPGPVFFSMVDDELRHRLEAACAQLKIPCMSVLDPFIAPLGAYLKAEPDGKAGGQHVLDTDYFARIAALDFTIKHDDGQHQDDLDEADVILTGVSRTSKTPTCMYLAHRGVKAANVPLVPSVEPPPELLAVERPLVIGLVAGIERLQQLRKNRLLTLHETDETDYIDPDVIEAEMTEAKRLFARQSWPIIDVTRRSIEEVATAIMNLHQEHVEARDR